MHMSYEFTPIFVGISSCLVRVPGSERSARSSSRQVTAVAGPAFPAPPAAELLGDPVTPVTTAAPAPSPLLDLGKLFFRVNL